MKLDAETAESEFGRFVDEMDLDLEESEMDAEDLGAFRKQKGRVLKALRRGSLVIEDNGEPTFTTSDGQTITLHERTGASLMAMDGRKKGHDVAKMYAVLADMSRKPVSTFAKMRGRDIKVLEALFAFLLD